MNTVGPFIIWKTQKIPTITKFIELGDAEFISERDDCFRGYDLELKKLGFDAIGSSMLEDSHTKSHFRLYWHSDIQVAAMVVTMKSNVEECTYLEFTQEYEDGSVLDVNNSPQPEAYPRLKFKRMYRLPNIKSAEELLNAHAKIKSKLASNAIPKDFDVELGFSVVEAHLKRESDTLVEMGLLKSNINDDGKRALTLKGAIAMTYRSVNPGKKIWGRLNEKRAQGLL
jgi:hypothetical protein